MLVTKGFRSYFLRLYFAIQISCGKPNKLNPTLDINILKFENWQSLVPGLVCDLPSRFCNATFVQCTEIRISTRYYWLQATTYAYATENTEKKVFFFIVNFLLVFIRGTKIFVYQLDMSRL